MYTFSHPTSARLLNSIRGIYYHFPYAKVCDNAFYSWVESNTLSPYKRENACVYSQGIHEDIMSNTVSMLFLLLLPFYWFFNNSKFSIPTKLFVILPLFSWILLHFFVQDQPWISRLQTPVFSVMPLATVNLTIKKYFNYPTKLFMLILILISLFFISNNRSRKLENVVYAIYNRVEMYYNNRPDLYPLHNEILHEAKESGCKILGLHMGGDSWDYPLAWQGFKSGIRIEQVKSNGDFERFCGVYSESKDFKLPGFDRGKHLLIIKGL